VGLITLHVIMNHDNLLVIRNRQYLICDLCGSLFANNFFSVYQGNLDDLTCMEAHIYVVQGAKNNNLNSHDAASHLPGLVSVFYS